MAVLSPSPPARHPPQHLRHRVERGLAGDEGGRVDPAVRDQPVGLAEARGGVVERRGDRQLLVVQPQGVERDARVGGPAREQVDEPALAHRPDRGLGRLGRARRPRSPRRAPAAASPLPEGLRRRPRLAWRRSPRRPRARAPCASRPALRPTTITLRPAQAGERPASIRPIEPGADHRDGLARPRCCSARCRARRRRAAPPWPPRGSRLPVERHEVASPRSARGSARTRRRPRSRTGGRRRGSRGRPGSRGRRRRAPSWRRPRASPGRTPSTPGPTSSTTPATSWPKTRGRLEHARVVAAAEDLDVGAAGERRSRAQQDLARARAGGSSTSSRRTSSRPWSTAARIRRVTTGRPPSAARP